MLNKHPISSTYTFMNILFFSTSFCPRWTDAFVEDDMNSLHISMFVFAKPNSSIDESVTSSFFFKYWWTFPNNHALRSSRYQQTLSFFCHRTAFVSDGLSLSAFIILFFVSADPLLCFLCPVFKTLSSKVNYNLHSWECSVGYELSYNVRTPNHPAFFCVVFDKSQILSWSGSLMGVGSSSAGTILSGWLGSWPVECGKLAM